MTTQPVSMLDAALGLAARGFSVFPIWWKRGELCACGDAGCKSPCKHPLGALVRDGCHDATREPDTIRRWWSEYPDANIGIATGAPSGVWVFDVDEGSGGDVSLASLVEQHGPVPGTLRVRTGRGWHYYFAYQPGMKNSAGATQGLDARGDGGYVVAPPSMHATGRRYEIADDVPVVVAPLWVLDALRRKKDVDRRAAPRAAANPTRTTPYGRKALEQISEELAAIKKGGRDNARNGASYRVGRLVAGGHIDRTDGENSLLDACERNGLISEEGYETVRKRIDRGIEDGVAAGPMGPDPAAQHRPEPGVNRDTEGSAAGAGSPAPAASSPPAKALPPQPPKRLADGSPFPEVPSGMPEPPPDNERATDVGNGLRLVRMYGDNIRHVHGWGWLVWDGKRWQRDQTAKIEELSKRSVAEMFREVSVIPGGPQREEWYKHAVKSEKAERVRAAVAMAQSERRVVANVGDFDRDPFTINVLNGTLDLKSGRLRPHARTDNITHLAPVQFDENAVCPLWERFLEQIYSGNRDLVRFVQRAIGYTLTGMTTEQCFFILHGHGSNGKSTLLRAMSALFGNGYSTNANFATFLASSNPGQYGPRPDLARLAGARFVMSTEPDEGARFSESVIKSITGGDPITAALKYENDFEFIPVLKLWLSVNHKPKVGDTSHAMWRRIRLIPHEVIIADAQQDKRLDAKLALELPGILNWAIRGALEWLTFGLEPPTAVIGATAAYREEQDVLGQFIEERCRKIAGQRAKAGDLYAAYAAWSKARGEWAMGANRFGRLMTEKGFDRIKDSVFYYRDILLVPEGH